MFEKNTLLRARCLRSLDDAVEAVASKIFKNSHENRESKKNEDSLENTMDNLVKKSRR